VQANAGEQKLSKVMGRVQIRVHRLIGNRKRGDNDCGKRGGGGKGETDSEVCENLQ